MSTALELLELYQLEYDDLKRIQSFGGGASAHIEAVVDDWYLWMEKQPEYDEFFADPMILNRVKRMVQDYWRDFLQAQVDDIYVEKRNRIGLTHARIGLPLAVYFAAMNVLNSLWLHVPNEAEDDTLVLMESLTKLVNLDTAVVVIAYADYVNDTIREQSTALLEMSTPVTQIWDGILLIPIVGIIDSKRSQDIMNAALAKIAETQARVFIMDISGVAVVDTAVANYLIKITKATRLMGCESIISGVSPAIAQTIVDLGINVGTVKTTATMRDALSGAFKRMGMEITYGS
ncbi:MAG: STAS domain-containing protein [Trueperaceae bacterium]|nr:MAG: STAS domain-containing protein [Trueperaceae bacterium]